LEQEVELFALDIKALSFYIIGIFNNISGQANTYIKKHMFALVFFMENVIIRKKTEGEMVGRTKLKTTGNNRDNFVEQRKEERFEKDLQQDKMVQNYS
jgi:hypothetical protein